MMAGYTLAVDFGTTRSAGAVCSAGGVEVLEFGSSRFLPSVVVLDDQGVLVAGRPALNQAGRVSRTRVEFTPKRTVGQPAVVLGGQSFTPVPSDRAARA